MSWQDDVMIEQERADALSYMGEAEWREMFEDENEKRNRDTRMEKEKKSS